MPLHYRIVFFVYMLTLNYACSESPKNTENEVFTANELKEPLIKTNKFLTRSEKQDIDDLVNRYGWEMLSTGTGLRYQFLEKGNGIKPREGNIVKANYTIKLLTGEIVYDSKTDGLLEFQVGKGGVPAGIEEGILLTGLQDKVRFILPSHLAFGLLGDSKRIPPRSVLIYEIEILDLQ